MTSTTKRAKCLSGSHSSTDGGGRYPVARSIVRKLLTSAHPETKKGRINVSILPAAAQCAKSDRLLERDDFSSSHDRDPACCWSMIFFRNPVAPSRDHDPARTISRHCTHKRV